MKPDDIPQGVWDAAAMALEPVSGTYLPARLVIARAIMAEREACAELSIDRGLHLGEPAIGSYIATAIRSRP